MLKVACLGNLSGLHELVTVGLRLDHDLVHKIDLLSHQLKELDPILLAEVRIIFTFRENLEQFLELYLGPLMVFLEGTDSEISQVEMTLLLLSSALANARFSPCLTFDSIGIIN